MYPNSITAVICPEILIKNKSFIVSKPLKVK